MKSTSTCYQDNNYLTSHVQVSNQLVRTEVGNGDPVMSSAYIRANTCNITNHLTVEILSFNQCIVANEDGVFFFSCVSLSWIGG